MTRKLKGVRVPLAGLCDMTSQIDRANYTDESVIMDITLSRQRGGLCKGGTGLIFG